MDAKEAGALEELAKDGWPESAPERLAKLRALWERTQEAIAGWR